METTLHLPALAENQSITSNQNISSSISTQFEKYLAITGLAKRTVCIYGRIFREFLGGRVTLAELQGINAETVKRYIDFLDGKECGNRTFNLHIAALNKAFKYLKYAKVITENPLAAIMEVKKLTRKTVTSVSAPSIWEVKECADRTSKTGLLISFLATTACRISEALDIKLTDCHEYSRDGIQYREIDITGKGRKERKIYIPGALYFDIMRVYNGSIYLFETSGGKRMLSENAYKQIRRRFSKIGVKCGCHSLRHFWATHKITVEKQDIKATSSYLGHSNISTTLSYYVKSSLPVENCNISFN